MKCAAIVLVVMSTCTLISLVHARARDCPKSGSVFEERTHVRSEPKFPVVRDCQAWKALGLNTSGIYPVKPDTGKIFQVYCDMESDGGGWTIFQRRMDGSVDFYRTWSDYQYGFGDLAGEYWLGLDKIHRLTNNRRGEYHELRVDMTTYKNQSYYTQYSSFSVGDADSKYILSVGGYYKGNGPGEALNYHNGMKFTTKDQDNDGSNGANRAITCQGGFWYTSSSYCYYVNINGKYSKKTAKTSMIWHWHTSGSHKFTEMKCRVRV